MQFVKIDDLKSGMRLARPIYNKQGVLLFERDSKITSQGIASISNFGLIGLFILEPAEPAPPMTQEDLEFERFQTMVVYSIQEELERIASTKKQSKLDTIAANVVKHYGHLDKKINFVQNLRSKEDFMYKHVLNVAILCAMISHVMNIRLDEQNATILASIIHDIGKLSLSPEVLYAEELTKEIRDIRARAETGAYELIESLEGTAVKRICMQSQKAIYDIYEGTTSDMKMVTGAKILAVADTYDTMTAMKLDGAPVSEVAALKFMLEHPNVFDAEVVGALIKSINILGAGTSVELSTGAKALVINANENNILYPMVLSFNDNSIIDLSDRRTYGDVEIVDIMKTLDNRCVMDTESLKKMGFNVE